MPCPQATECVLDCGYVWFARLQSDTFQHQNARPCIACDSVLLDDGAPAICEGHYCHLATDLAGVRSLQHMPISSPAVTTSNTASFMLC